MRILGTLRASNIKLQEAYGETLAKKRSFYGGISYMSQRMKILNEIDRFNDFNDFSKQIKEGLVFIHC